MTLAAARAACPGAPRSARVARRPGYNPYARRDWLRISHRLATGTTAGEVARAEAVDVAEIDGLLAQPDFSGLVDAARALAARPDAEQTARLVTLARFALEMALADGDMRVALFILREADGGRDPAATVAKGVLAAARRGTRGGTAAPGHPAGTRPRPGHRGRPKTPTRVGSGRAPWPCKVPSSPSTRSATPRPSLRLPAVPRPRLPPAGLWR